MGRYTGPACKRCRREGIKLFLKGARCFMAKCPIETGRPLPGMHGARRTKLSDYGRQFREKQRLMRIYGLRDGQFRIFFERARRRRGNTGEHLLQDLEMRLDNLVFRAGFASSRSESRQMVLHGHLAVNGRKASTPSMVLKPETAVEVRPGRKAAEIAKRNLEASNAARPACPWLEVDKENLKVRVLRFPTREEIAPVVDEQLVVELCSK